MHVHKLVCQFFATIYNQPVILLNIINKTLLKRHMTHAINDITQDSIMLTLCFKHVCLSRVMINNASLTRYPQ